MEQQPETKYIKARLNLILNLFRNEFVVLHVAVAKTGVIQICINLTTASLVNYSCETVKLPSMEY
jgi:hypothetical protein